MEGRSPGRTPAGRTAAPTDLDHLLDFGVLERATYRRAHVRQTRPHARHPPLPQLAKKAQSLGLSSGIEL